MAASQFTSWITADVASSDGKATSSYTSWSETTTSAGAVNEWYVAAGSSWVPANLVALS